MKTIILTLLFALCSTLLFPQNAVEKKLIAKLGPGEKLAHGENSFMLTKNPETFSFVTISGSGDSKQYFCYGKDGSKTGPVKEPNPSYWAETKDNPAEDCIPNDEPQDADMMQYMDWASGSVNFNGKTYGPYGQLIKMHVTVDGQNFFAVAMNAEMKITFFDSKNRKVELINAPEEIIVSPDGTKAYAKVKGTINPFEPGAIEKMMNNPEEMNNPPINLVGIDGTKIGPFSDKQYKDAWFIAPAKLVVYNNSEVSVDGKLLFRSEDYISPCDMWIGSDGKSYAWANYQNLIFNDGTKYAAPIVINHTGGFLKWITLENGTDLVFYKKSF